MEIPLPIIILGIIGLYGLFFAVAVTKLAGRNDNPLSRWFGPKEADEAFEEDAPIAPKRVQIIPFDQQVAEVELDRDQKVS